MKRLLDLLHVLEPSPRQRLDDLLDALPPIHRASSTLPNRTLDEPDDEWRVPGEDIRDVRRVLLVDVVDDEAEGFAREGEGGFRDRVRRAGD